MSSGREPNSVQNRQYQENYDENENTKQTVSIDSAPCGPSKNMALGVCVYKSKSLVGSLAIDVYSMGHYIDYYI